MKKRLSFLLLVCAFLFGGLIWGTHSLMASPTGITGFSGELGQNCSTCHSGGVEPDVAFVGSGIAAPGETLELMFTISGGQEAGGGFNVSADDGTLAVLMGDMDVKLSGDELTHTEPKSADADGAVTFAFSWTAPNTPGIATLYGAGNSVNLDGRNSGDAGNTAVVQIAIGSFPEKVYLPQVTK